MFRTYNQRNRLLLMVLLLALLLSCKLPSLPTGGQALKIPDHYYGQKDTASADLKPYRQFYTSPHLRSLIDTVIARNYDLAIAAKRIEYARAGVIQTKGLLRPQANAVIAPGVRKFGLYTMDGAGNSATDIEKGKVVPVDLPDLYLGIQASWELDIWGKLKSRKASAFAKVMATQEAKQAIQTSLIAEAASAYYELMAEDEMLRVIDETISLQEQALETVRIQKQSAQANELAVQQFEAQLLGLRSMRTDVLQQIAVQENRIHALCGQWSGPVQRDTGFYTIQAFDFLRTGIPSQLLSHRPDIRQAEWELLSTRSDLKAARAAFLPSVTIGGGVGVQAYRASLLFLFPESLAYTVAAGLTQPLFNRSQIKAEFAKASAVQGEALLNYEKLINRGYLEADLSIRKLRLLDQMVELKKRQQEVLSSAVNVSAELFRTGRATYLEVLLTRQSGVSTSMELIRAKRDQYLTTIELYRSLGGGWN